MIKDIIFGLFGTWEKQIDTFKDGNGKGTLERYNEVMADEYDINLEPNITNMLDNVMITSTCDIAYMPLLEEGIGNQLILSTDEQIKRDVQRHIVRYYEIKGSIRAYRIMLGLIGFNVTITEEYIESGFDSPFTFDADERTFDSGCASCSCYKLDLTRKNGDTSDMTPVEYAGVLSIIAFNQPINAKMCGLTLDGEEIEITEGDFSNSDFNDDFF